MTQPLDRTCQIEPLGKINEDAGEFWANPFEMAHLGHNLSAYEPNRLFLNAGGREFIEASFASAADIDADSRSAMVGDFDGDGAPDLLVGSVGGGSLRLFRNRLANTQRVDLRLVGRDSNRAGIGARVEAWCGGKRMVREVFPANGFMGQSPPRLYLGVGSAEQIDRLVVHWPSGLRQELSGVPVGGVVTITEGAAAAGIQPFRQVTTGEP